MRSDSDRQSPRPRLLYGLQRLPTTLAADDPRLPAVNAGETPLRLNSVPLPAAAWGSGTPDHAVRMTAMQSWLLDSCGDYDAGLRRAVTRYLDAVATHIQQHHNALAALLAPFDGLYRVEDWCWSALRPLPRAWWQQNGAWQCSDLAFWDGIAVIAMRPQDFESDELPAPFQYFWTGQTLPVSPFRRIFPAGPDGVFLRPSSP
jgi:hypothetical protein